MPVEWRLHVLEERLNQRFGDVFEIVVTDLLGLTLAEQTAAIDAMIATGGSFPITLVNGVAACVDDIDLEAISEKVGGSL